MTSPRLRASARAAFECDVARSSSESSEAPTAGPVAPVTRPPLRDPRSDDQPAANGGWTLPGRLGVTLPVTPEGRLAALADSPGCDPQADDGSQQANVVAVA